MCSATVTFKSKPPAGFWIAMTCSFSVIAALGVRTIVSHQFGSVIFLYFWSVSWCYLLVVTSFISSNADVRVDSEGLSRLLLGRVWQSIRWDNVSVVREFSFYSQVDKDDVVCVHIFPKKLPLLKFAVSGRMAFSDDVESFDRLIGLLNDYIAKHQIKAEMEVNSIWLPVNELSTTMTDKIIGGRPRFR